MHTPTTVTKLKISDPSEKCLKLSLNVKMTKSRHAEGTYYAYYELRLPLKLLWLVILWKPHARHSFNYSVQHKLCEK